MRRNQKKSNFSKFMLLWAGEFLSAIGGGLTSFGLGVYVFSQTGSAASMALVTLLAFLPTVLLSVPAGVLADRYDRRVLMMVGDGCSALGILYLLICMISGKAALYQICIGVFVSSVFSALLEPAYRATVTDLLTEEEYSKASGMVSIAGSARYLISPVLAGVLLAVSDIRLLLVIDMFTFFPTVIAAAIVRKEIAVKNRLKEKDTFAESLRQGWRTIKNNRGLFLLLLVSMVITCFMGICQTLVQPMILDFTDSAILGMTETVCACGMLVTSLYLGVKGIKGGYVRTLSFSLFFAGIGMVGFGMRESIPIICGFGFLFFAMLPFANNCLDYLVRTNIPDEQQGRAWGIIGLISQMGYIVAYSVAGITSDGIAVQFGISVGRGAASVIILAGILLCMTAVALYGQKSIRALEGGTFVTVEEGMTGL